MPQFAPFVGQAPDPNAVAKLLRERVVQPATDFAAPTTGTLTEAGTRLLPFAGEAWAVDDAKQSFDRSNYKTAAAQALLGLLPGGALAAGSMRAMVRAAPRRIASNNLVDDVIAEQLEGVMKNAGKKPHQLLREAPQTQALRDAQAHAALPVEQHGLGLPVDNTPQMRMMANKMFPEPAYHSTTKSYDKFDVNLTSPAASFGKGAYLSDTPGWVTRGEGSNVMPLQISKDGVLPMAPLSVEDADQLSQYLGRTVNAGDPPPMWSLERHGGDVGSGLSAAGFNGLEHAPPAGNARHTLITNPDNIRSRFAAFDPWRRTTAIATLTGMAAPDLLAAENPDTSKQLEFARQLRQVP